MTVKEMFEKVLLKTNVDQRTFLNALNDTQAELMSAVGVKEVDNITSIEDDIAIDTAYHNAMTDNVLYLIGQGENYKGEFLRKAEDVRKRIWSEKIRGKTIKRSGW